MIDINIIGIDELLNNTHVWKEYIKNIKSYRDGFDILVYDVRTGEDSYFTIRSGNILLDDESKISNMIYVSVYNKDGLNNINESEKNILIKRMIDVFEFEHKDIYDIINYKISENYISDKEINVIVEFIFGRWLWKMM